MSGAGVAVCLGVDDACDDVALDEVAPGTRHPWDVGVAGATSLQGDLAPGAMLDAHYGWAGSSLAVRVAILGTAAHARSLAALPGQAQWSRAAVALGGRDRITGGNLMLDGTLIGARTSQGTWPKEHRGGGTRPVVKSP